MATSRDISNNANSLLPSPSPSIGTPPQSAKLVDLEDEVGETQTAGTIPADSNELGHLLARYETKYGYEELKRKLEEMEKPLSVPVRHTSSPAAADVLRTSEKLRTWLSAEDITHLNHDASSQIQNDSQLPSATNKRQSEALSEPRKRMQSLPELSSKTSEQMIPATLQQRLIPNAPSEAVMQFFGERAVRRLHSTNVPDRPGSGYERPRIGLLRDACANSDFFYLCLHQLFCVYHLSQTKDRVIPFLEDAQRDGLNKLPDLLVRNDDLSADAIEWFSTFPLPWDILYTSKPAFQSALFKVLSSLKLLSRNWQTMKDKCHIRGWPPLVEEMLVLFGIESFTFQQVVFRALLRDIWKGPQDNCYQLTEEVFAKNYKASMQHDTEDEERTYDQAVINELQKIASCHRGHMQQQASQRNMLPPQQCQPSLVRTNTNRTLQHSQSIARSNNPYQRIQPAPTTLLTTSLSSPSTTHHSGHSIITGSASRQGAPAYQNIAVDTATYRHGTSLPRSPAGGLQDSSMSTGFRSPRQSQDQQTMLNQSMSDMPVLSNSTPSGIIGSPAQSIPRALPAHQVLPSNVHSRGPPRPQQRNPSQRQPPVLPYTPASQIGPYSPLQPRSLYDAQHQGCEGACQPQSPQTLLQNSAQFIRANPDLNQSQPNPTLNALHQAHVRSPTLSSFDLYGKPINLAKTFKFIKYVIMPPGEVSSKKRHLKWDFEIERALADTLARDIPGSYGCPPVRMLFPGSRLCRIRCIKVNKAGELPSQSEWVVSDNVWHSSTAIVLNGHALEIRKKSHHGKDLPIDVTSYIKEGANSISTAVIGFPDGSTTRYAIGVEVVEVIEEQLIRSNITTLPWQEARKRIIDRSINLDPDVMVVNSQMVIDLRDPFSAQLFEIPTRGTSCRHNQCFDRDIFLETRHSRNANEPCVADVFQCPICGSDARPQNLVIDAFFVQIREELQKRGRLDAKAIILHPSGDWEVKEEEEATGEQGDGTGRRHSTQAQTGASRPSTGRQSTPREIIQIDDDL